MEFSFDARVVITMQHKKGQSTSKHLATDFNIDVSKNLDRNHYLDNDDLPTMAGTKALTVTLIHGLLGNIHRSHQEGMWDSAEHLRYIIKELEKGFIYNVDVSKSNF